MLNNATIGVRLPAQDLERARAWYAEKLGLEPVEHRPGAYRYELNGTDFAIFASQGRSRADFTQMGFYVEDVDAAVAQLRERRRVRARGADRHSRQLPEQGERGAGDVVP